MLGEEQKEILESALQRGLAFHDRSITECLANLDASSNDKLANLTFLGQALNVDGITHFFDLSGEGLSESELMAFLVTCLQMNLIQQITPTDDNTLILQVRYEVYSYYLAHAKIEDQKRYRRNADKFILEQIASLATELGNALPDGDARRRAIIGPNSFLDYVAHLPQHQELHQFIINLSITWFDHLFWLEEYEEAADILNSICFALARLGQRKLAENMLVAIVGKTKGVTSVVAQANLATLLREEGQISVALRLYWRCIPKFIGQKAYVPLAQVLSEIAAVYRQRGNLIRSAILLEFSVKLNAWLKNETGTAIAHSQLASTYRQLKIFPLALKNSMLAVDQFRKSNDLLNLGRSLLTQGNILYNLSESESAFKSFNEALEIVKLTADPQAEIEAISGKARVFLSLELYDEALSLLNTSISLRERNNDHLIGIEYQNMGSLHEQKGDYAMALGWYKKALSEFEKYIPVEVPGCKMAIAKVQLKYRGQ